MDVFVFIYDGLVWGWKKVKARCRDFEGHAARVVLDNLANLMKTSSDEST